MLTAAIEDHLKRRLTEPGDIELAIALLEAEGYAAPDILVEMLKTFYVDLDALHEIIREAA